MLTGVVLAIVLLASIAIAGGMRGYALHQSLMDHPGPRSSHTVSTPRAGGVAIVLTVIGALAFLWSRGLMPTRMAVVIMGGGLLVALVGFLDDRRRVPIGWRLLIQLVVAVWVTGWLGPIAPVVFGPVALDLGWLFAPIMVLWVMWGINLFNFMDGIDGLAGVQAVTVAGSVAIILWLSGQNNLALVVATYCVASTGFLVWNWPPAEIFMGDVGSGFLGFSFAALALLLHDHGSVDIWVWLILMSVFLLDATLTLLRRAVRRERVWVAHRIHGYQHSVRKYGAHRIVTVAIAMINLCWLLPLALTAAWRPESGWWLTLVAWTPVTYLLWKVGAGSRDD